MSLDYQRASKVKTYVPFTSVNAQDFDRDKSMASATLAVCKRTEDPTMELADPQKLLRLCCALHANLS